MAGRGITVYFEEIYCKLENSRRINNLVATMRVIKYIPVPLGKCYIALFFPFFE